MKEIIHSTKVRISIPILRGVVEQARQDFLNCGDTEKQTTTGRSFFSRWNNMNHMLERIDTPFTEKDEDCVILSVYGEADNEACARVYYNPSFTSLAADFRRAILPLNPGNEFLFFDLKAAEFLLFNLFAGESEVLTLYLRGEDVYDALAHYFPQGTARKEYKTPLIASLYGGTPYSTAKRLGISEKQATRLHESVAKALPRLERLKAAIRRRAVEKGHYCYPTNFDLNAKEFNVVPYKPASKAIPGIPRYQPVYNENLALSVFVQSALGYWMQKLIKEVEQKSFQLGTFLTVFDSVLIEVNPAQRAEAETFFRNRILPFKTSEFKHANNFYDAYKD